MKFTWREKYEVGVKLIDKQHQKIFEQANKLLTASKEQRGRDEVQEMLEFLMDYIEEHFADEEELQQEYDYPDYKVHKRIHSKFTERVKKLADEVEAEGVKINTVMELNKLVTRWLVKHIRREDRELADYIKQQEE